MHLEDRNNQNSNQTYKILVLDPHAKDKNDFSPLKPRHLQLDKEICVIDYSVSLVYYWTRELARIV